MIHQRQVLIFTAPEESVPHNTELGQGKLSAKQQPQPSTVWVRGNKFHLAIKM